MGKGRREGIVCTPSFHAPFVTTTRKPWKHIFLLVLMDVLVGLDAVNGDSTSLALLQT